MGEELEVSLRSGVSVGDGSFGGVEESETSSEDGLEIDGSIGGLGRSILSAAAEATAISERRMQMR